VYARIEPNEKNGDFATGHQERKQIERKRTMEMVYQGVYAHHNQL
jgi:hypothetical protein